MDPWSDFEEDVQAPAPVDPWAGFDVVQDQSSPSPVASAPAQADEWSGFEEAPAQTSAPQDEWSGFEEAQPEYDRKPYPGIVKDAIAGVKGFYQEANEASGGTMEMLSGTYLWNRLQGKKHASGDMARSIVGGAAMMAGDQISGKVGEGLTDFGSGQLDQVAQGRSGRAQERIEENPGLFGGEFKDESSFARLATGAGASAPGMVVSMAMPWTGTALLTLSEGLPEYKVMRDKGVDPDTAAQRAALSMAGTAVLERIGIDAAMSKLIPVNRLVRTLGRKGAIGATIAIGGIGEGSTELIQTAWQYASREGYDGSLKEFMAETDELETFLIGGLMGTTMAGPSAVGQVNQAQRMELINGLKQEIETQAEQAMGDVDAESELPPGMRLEGEAVAAPQSVGVPELPEGFRLGLPMRREVGLNDLTGTQSEGTTALSPQEEAQLPVNQVAARQEAEVAAWRAPVDQQYEDAAAALNNRYKRTPLREIDHPVAQLRNRILEGGGLINDGSIEAELWKRIPNAYKRNPDAKPYARAGKEGKRAEAARQAQARKLRNQGDGVKWEDIRMDLQAFGLGDQSQATNPTEILSMLQGSKMNPDGSPAFPPDWYKEGMRELNTEGGHVPKLSREQMEATPVGQVLRMFDPDALSRELYEVKPDDLEVGDIVRLDAHLYQVQEQGRVKVLRDGQILDLEQGSNLWVNGVVKPDSPLYPKLRDAYNRIEQKADPMGDAATEAPPMLPEGMSLEDLETDAATSLENEANRQQADSALAEGDVRASETTSEQASEGRNGDAVDSALIEHSAMIRSELRKMGVRPGEMEDMMQDVALRALDKANTFDPNKAKVQTWLGAVARNVAKNQFAKNTAGMRDQRLTASLQAPVGGEGTTELQDLIAAKGPDRSISAYQEALAVTPLQDLEADVRDGVLAGKGVEDIAAEQGFTPQKIRGILRVVGRKAQKNLPPEVDEWRGELNDPAEELNKRFAKVPDWTKGDGESKQGANLVAQAAAKGRNAAGVADIVQYVNKLVQVEMRRSKSQTSRKHPAHYRRTGHLAMTRNTQSQINFHEAGHGLKELLVNQMGGEGFFQDPGVRNSLLRLTKRPGSMASAENVHEGVAEWMRLKVTNPGSIQDTTIDVRMESAISKYLPNVLPGIRDAARAYNRFMNQPAAQRWATFNKDQRQAPTMKEGLNVVLHQGQKLVEGLASGAPVSRLDRQFARQAKKAYREAGDTLKVAAEKMRKSRKRTQELIEGHNILLQIGAETQLAYSGSGPARGVRYIDQKGKVNVLLPRTWNDIIKTIPPQYYEQFEQAGWALESLNRHVQDGMEYPGFREGISLEDLKGIVAQAEKEIPNFKRHFDEVQSYFDALLDLRERSGMLAKGEKSKIQRREMYWPLPRVMNSPAGHRGATGADMGTGLRRAFGSGEAIQDLNTVAEHYTRQAYSSVYWNQFANQMFDNLQSMAKDNALPMEVRSAAGRVMIPLKMPQQKVAEVSKEWIVKQAYDAVAQNIAEQTGESVKQVKEWFQPENLNLATEFQKIYSPGRPNDVNVLSFLKDGERQYVQVSDDALFMGFAKGKELSAFWEGANWLLRPAIENWKRNITQSLLFAVNNLLGDIINQTMMNTDKVGWFPGGATVLGVMNKFSKKYPQVFQEGLLLSRVQPTKTELLRNMKQNAVMRFLTEGLYVSQHPDKTVRLLQTVFQPANWLFPLFKAGDIVNLVTLGKTISPFLESATREGASVAALKRGATDREAMLAYWNVTGPFNEHSPSADLRSALAMPGFLNPQIQAVRRTSQLLTDPDPAIAATAWTKLMVMVPAVFGSIAALRFAMMDDDEKDRERERPLDDRLNYHDVMGFRARFPYGPEGAMASLVYNSVMDDLLDRSRVDGRRKSIQLLKRIADAGSPTQFLGPQINTLQEAGSNWSYFRQRHIVSPWLVNLPAAEQHYTTTPAFYKKVGRFLEYSPTKLEYIVNQGLSRQVGEIVRILDNMDRNKPIGEMADLPFIGRMFMRNPAGWFAQSPQDLSKVQATLSQIDRRLRDSGWSWIKDAPYGQIRDKDLYALRVQLDQLESLKAAVRQMPRYGQLSKAYQAGERWEEERNVRRAMVMHAQAALAHNEQEIEHLDTVLDLLEKIGDAPPEIREWDYRRRTGLTE